MGYDGTPILFPPARVKSVLAHMPTLAALIPDPEEEGVESQAFSGVLRKTDTELYRWIANTHYEHLVEPVRQLEEVHLAGCKFERMLTTPSRELFVSLSTEAFLAHDLLRRGYEVETIKRSAVPSPDLRVRGRGMDMVVEVYTPRELRHVDQWTRELTDLMQYLDVRASFNFSGDTVIERAIPPNREQLDPWAHDKMLEQTGATVMAEIRGDVEDALRDLHPIVKSYAHPETPMSTTVTISDVRLPPDAGPQRGGTFSYPGFSGYSPVGVFRRIVERTIRKAEKRQTHTIDAETRSLLVNLMQTQIAPDLTHPAYSKQAEAVLDELVDPADYGLDVIAFVVRALPHGLAYVLAIADDARLTLADVDALFGQTD
jgi:hypothetical protein